MEQREQNKIVPENGATAKKPNLWKIGLFTLVPIVALLVILVLVIVLIPVFRLMSVNGTYYASVDGEIVKEEFFKLDSGKWTTSDGSKGEYEFLGGELLMRANSASEEVHYHATVKNGVLIIEGAEQNNVFVSESHKHEYVNVVTMEQIDGRWVAVERLSDCEKGGLAVRLCACGARIDDSIQPHGHTYYTETVKSPTCAASGEELVRCRNCEVEQTREIEPTGQHSYYTETVKYPTCGEIGEEIVRCRNCDIEQTREIAATGVHLSFSDGRCQVCEAVQLKYKLSGDGTHYIVTDFAERMEYNVVSIMETYEGLPVTEIAPNAFSNIHLVMNFEIPAFITKIGEGAFRGCDAFSTMRVDKANPVYHSAFACLIETESKTLLCGYPTSQIPADGSVTKIAHYAFCRNEGLRSIEISDCITEIGANAFQDCTKLISVKLPSGLQTISHSLFLRCTALESITIPNGVQTIEPYAFSGCEKLKSVFIPLSVTRIGAYAFFSCDSLLSITIPIAVTEIGQYAFAGCINMASIDFQSSVLKIGKEAFSLCIGLEKISIAKNASFLLSEEMFTKCPNLNELYFDGTLEEWEKIKDDVYGFNRHMTIHCTDWRIIIG